MSTVDDLNQILGQGNLEMNEARRSSILRHLNVDPRWDISDKNFATISSALQLIARRIDEFESARAQIASVALVAPLRRCGIRQRVPEPSLV